MDTHAYFKLNYFLLSSIHGKSTCVINEKSTSCRYCKKQHPDIKFRSKAHTIPESLGNKNIISGDECDECNAFFGSTIDNCIAQFTLSERSYLGIEGKRGIPGFKSQDKKTIMSPTDRSMHIVSNGDSQIHINTNGTLEIAHSFETYPYVPLNVFKCFTKMAIAIAPNEEIDNFSETIGWLMRKCENALPPDESTKLFKYYFSTIKSIHPVARLYKKKTLQLKIPEFIFSLAFDRFVYFAIIPYTKGNSIINGDSTIIYPPPPPETHEAQKNPDFKILDMSSNVKKSQRHSHTYNGVLITPPPPSSLPNPPDGGDAAD